MKYIIILMLLSLSLLGDNLNWSNNYAQGLLDAEKENKIIYILITSQSCKWCRKFESTTLQNELIKKRLYSEFITIHLSRDEDIIPSIFKTAPIPRHYFVSKEGKIIYSSLGHRGIECFDSFMDNAHERLKLNKE